jgi:sarcosine oxidase subunit beta
VHVVESPADFQLETGAPGVNDSDLGIYFRPQPGGSIVVGGVEAECDPLVFVDDPDSYDEHASVASWEAQTYRLARRIPSVTVPSRPVGLAALYDVTPDWVPVYDRTSLDGYYVAIGTSGNQFKNSPMVGRIMSTLIDAGERGHDHDADPVQLACEYTGNVVNLGHFSRLRTPADTTHSVLG